MAETQLRPLSIGEIVDAGFALYRRHFVQLAIIGIIAQGIPAVFRVFTEAAGGFTNVPLPAVLGLILGMVGAAVGTGASTVVVADGYLGRATTAFEAIQRVKPVLGALILAPLLITLIATFGFILFIVPGFIAFTGYSVAFCAVAVERLTALEGMRRSWELTKGHRWRAFSVLLVIVALMVVVGGPATLLTALFFRDDPETAVIIVAAVSGLLSIFVYPFAYCGFTVLYYDLRVRKEGLDLAILEEQLAAV